MGKVGRKETRTLNTTPVGSSHRVGDLLDVGDRWGDEGQRVRKGTRDPHVCGSADGRGYERGGR